MTTPAATPNVPPGTAAPVGSPATPPVAAVVPTPATPAAPPAPAAATGTVLGDPAATPEPPKAAAGETKAADPAAPPPAPAAGEYALKFPEGTKLDDPVLAKYAPLAKELGLKPEGAQKVVDLFSEFTKSQNEQQLAAVEAKQKGWSEELRADKDFGGDKLDANIAIARRAVARFGGEDLRTFLNETGLGDHPMLFRAFVKAGQALGEDTVAGISSADPAATPEAKQRAFLKGMYPNTPSLFQE